MLYEVTFEKNEVCQSNLVETEKSPVEIGHYFRDVKKTTYVFAIKIATSDSMRIGKPIIKL